MILIYKAIKDRLKGIIPHVDLFKGQYLYTEETEGFEFPAVFIEYSVAWENKGNGTQKGTVTFRFHIVTDNGYNTYGKEETDGLADLELYQAVHLLLQNFSGENFTKLTRNNEQPDVQPTNVHAHIVTYSCETDDNSTNLQKDLSEIDLEEMTIDRVQQGSNLTPKYNV